jgi:hypothetical protein
VAPQKFTWLVLLGITDGKVTDKIEGRWHAEKERNTNCDVPANNSLHTSNAYIARLSSTFLCFGNIMDWHADVCFMLEVTEADWLKKAWTAHAQKHPKLSCHHSCRSV